MKLKGTPNMLVRHNRLRRIKGIRPNQVWFRFDSDGFVELDDAKLHPRQIKALKAKFEVVEKDLKQLSYKELQQKYVEKTGNSAVGMKKKDLIKQLEV